MTVVGSEILSRVSPIYQALPTNLGIASFCHSFHPPLSDGKRHGDISNQSWALPFLNFLKNDNFFILTLINFFNHNAEPPNAQLCRVMGSCYTP